jgi:hypothetical protein
VANIQADPNPRAVPVAKRRNASFTFENRLRLRIRSATRLSNALDTHFSDWLNG